MKSKDNGHLRTNALLIENGVTLMDIIEDDIKLGYIRFRYKNSGKFWAGCIKCHKIYKLSIFNPLKHEDRCSGYLMTRE